MATQRSRQAKPTQDEVKRYWRLLKDRAEEGDVLATGLLLHLHYLSLNAEAEGGSRPETRSGWVSEDDSREKVIQTIRDNDPNSEQLPKGK